MDDVSLFDGDTEDVARFLVTFNEHADALRMSAQEKIRRVADCAPPRVSQAVHLYSEYLRSYQSHREAIAAWSALQRRMLDEFCAMHPSHWQQSPRAHDFTSTMSVHIRERTAMHQNGDRDGPARWQGQAAPTAELAEPHRVVQCRIGGIALDAVFADSVAINIVSEELWRTNEHGSTPAPSEYVQGVKTVRVGVEIAGIALSLRAHIVANAPFRVLLGQDFLRNAPVSVQWTADGSSFLVVQDANEEPMALARIRDVPESRSASKRPQIDVTRCLGRRVRAATHKAAPVAVAEPSNNPKWPAEGPGTCAVNLPAITPRHQSVVEVESASAAPSQARHAAIGIESEPSADVIRTESCPAAEGSVYLR
ncbi:hypothetical protein AURDEDRAFT_185922 [Auricularia subglabra TFB-10046 SS5]|nr:hypothetical protein AURDEDRAFT_185922 [Auricularia subglabra TFB-10046 SS5]